VSAPAHQPPLPGQPPAGYGPGPVPGQWGPPPWAHVRPTNTKAVLAVALLWVPVAPIVLGVLARREIARTGEGGYGMATWGLALGIAYASFFVLYFLFVIVYVVAIVGFASQAFTSGTWS
jgi:hypothetical protein